MVLHRQELKLNPQNDKFQKLVNEVLQKHIYPEDKYEIAAILESNGWNDDRAQEEFGADNLFALAEDLWLTIQKEITAQPFTNVKKLSRAEYVFMVIRSFLRGMIVALPMAVSVVAMLSLKFSLWSYLNLSLELATSIAIGTIMSFMAIGGFTQAIARRGFLYIGLGHYNLARRMIFYFVRLGYLVCILFSVFYLLFNLVFNIFPFRMVIVIVAYFFFLSTIWLSVTIMYVLEKELTFTGLLTGGIGLVFIFFRVYKMDIIISQLIALFIVSIAGALIAFYYFKKMEAKMEKGLSAPVMPRTSISIYTVLPYFAYGFLYFSFLFADRIIAWSTNTLFMPYLIWFRGPYELGLDFALLGLIIPMGFIEVVVSELMINMERNQKNYMVNQTKQMNKMYFRLYRKRMKIVFLFSLISAALVYVGIKYIHLMSFMPIKEALISSGTTHFVFVVGLVAYALLSVGLMNALILFCLSQPEVVAYAMLWSLFANLLFGFLLSRWIDHSYAVIGLLVGVVIFLYFTSKAAFKVLYNLDYYLYTTS